METSNIKISKMAGSCIQIYHSQRHNPALSDSENKWVKQCDTIAQLELQLGKWTCVFSGYKDNILSNYSNQLFQFLCFNFDNLCIFLNVCSLSIDCQKRFRRQCVSWPDLDRTMGNNMVKSPEVIVDKKKSPVTELGFTIWLN